MTQSFNNTTIANELYPVANAITSSNPFVVVFQTRDPTTADIQYPIQKVWLNTTAETFWFLQNFTTSNGQVFAHWIPYSGFTTVETLTGDDLLPVSPVANNIDVFGNAVVTGAHAKPVYFRHGSPPNGEIDLDVQVTVASGSSNINNAGLSSFLNTQFSVDANGFVTITNAPPSNLAFNYTNVVGPITYTVNVTTPPVDYYISCDATAGAITLNFPNAPTFKQLWIIKDRTGHASANNISITTPGGTVTFDGLTTYIMNSNFQAINLLANNNPNSNGNLYEVY